MNMPFMMAALTGEVRQELGSKPLARSCRKYCGTRELATADHTNFLESSRVAPGAFCDPPGKLSRMSLDCGRYNLWQTLFMMQMKAILWNRINPVKNLRELVADRSMLRVFVLASLALSWCS